MMIMNPNPSSLTYKIRMIVALLGAGVINVMLLARLLLSAIGPVKTPFFDIAFVGLVGLLFTDAALILRVIIKKERGVPLWITFAATVFLVMGLGGFLANIALR